MKIKWGVLGAGGIACRRTIPEGIVPAANAELVAVMDVVPEVTQKVAADFNATACATADELLAVEGLQAVYIASPANMHVEQFIQCAEAGKHILCEKPLANTLDQAV